MSSLTSGLTFVEGSVVTGHGGIAEVVLSLTAPQLVIFTIQNSALVPVTRDVRSGVSAVKRPKGPLREVSSVLESQLSANDLGICVRESFTTQD